MAFEDRGGAIRAMRRALSNVHLRRLELAWVGSTVGEWAYIAAIVTYLYQRDGPTAVGVLGLVRAGTAAVAAPFAGLAGDRYRRTRMIAGSELLRAAVLVAAAGVLHGSRSLSVVVALVAAEGALSTVFRPAQAAEIPALARDEEEASAANALASTIESIGFLLGPAIGGLLLAATTITTTLLATAAAFVLSAALVSRVPARAAARSAAQAAPRLISEATHGIRLVGRDPRLRIVFALFGAQLFAAGGLLVLISAVALDLLDVGRAGVGLFNSAIGAGALVGGVGALIFLRRGLSRALATGMILWGAPIVIIGAAPHLAIVIACLLAIGYANALVDVAGTTLLQRLAPPDVLGRIFGALESVLMIGAGLGGLAASALIATLGPRAALIIVGSSLPLLVLTLWRPLAAVQPQPLVPVAASGASE